MRWGYGTPDRSSERVLVAQSSGECPGCNITFLRGRAEGARVEVLGAERELLLLLDRVDLAGGRRFGRGPFEGMRRLLCVEGEVRGFEIVGRGGGGIRLDAEALGASFCMARLVTVVIVAPAS